MVTSVLNLWNQLRGLLQDIWCDWVHGGGTIQRDEQGRINWQCSKCGRWGEPVPLEEERRRVDHDITEHIKRIAYLR